MPDKEDKLVKVVLKSGVAINMYAPPETIDDLMYHIEHVRFKDNGNDNIYVDIDSIAAFEVLDDRRDPPKEGGDTNMPELPPEKSD